MPTSCKGRDRTGSETMAPPALLILITLLSLITLGASPSASQEEGFYSINCGGMAYEDPSTKILWDVDPFINNKSNEMLYGKAAKVSSSFKNISNVMKSLRYFPNDGKRNRKFCYPLQVSIGNIYLVRVSFLYGNYDGLNQPPKFALLFNYDEWTNVTTSSSTTPIVRELTFLNYKHNLDVCLAPHLNSSQTPFISTLEIRLLERTMYIKSSAPTSPSALSSGYGLMLWRRIDYGARSTVAIRYPEDRYDRIWEANTTGPIVEMLSSSKVKSNDTVAPEEVMATAITSRGPTENLSFTYDGYGGIGGFRMQLLFVEVDATVSAHRPRSFDLVFPTSLLQEVVTRIQPTTTPLSPFVDGTLELPPSLTISLLPLAASPRGPLLNAIELFRWTPDPFTTNGTYQGDVDAINNVQNHFKLMGYGQGDPCFPIHYAWTWIACSMDTIPRIIEINLGSFNLTGDIPSSINDLPHLQKIDLSNNNLSGEIPDVNLLLDLEYLDINDNNLTGELPSSLFSLPKLAKLDVSYNNLCGISPSFEQPMINYSYIGNKRLCDDINCTCSSSMSSYTSFIPNLAKGRDNIRKYVLSISFLGTFYILSMLALLITYMASQHKKMKYEKSKSVAHLDKKGVDDIEDLPFITKMFTYNEISNATLNFQTILGEGGFGKVYHGLLPSGEAIAVKILNDASKQGLKAFYNEVAILSRLCHRNLVTLIGYCVENTYMLVYEYVPKGNLRDLIYGEVESIDKPLSWKTRLHIAIDASQGLEYLHMGCDPTIIHRDVKSNNILLNEKMQAKVSDFGLSRLKEGDTTISHVSTINVVGTVGYLDPAYNATNQLTNKSDVYSFGVVLFELICGRAPIDMVNSPSHIVDWASKSIVEGKVAEIVDPLLVNGYNMESLRKVVDLALGCVESDRIKRPNMSQVLQHLQSALEIELGPNHSKDVSGSSSTSNGKAPILDHNSHI